MGGKKTPDAKKAHPRQTMDVCIKMVEHLLVHVLLLDALREDSLGKFDLKFIQIFKIFKILHGIETKKLNMALDVLP